MYHATRHFSLFYTQKHIYDSSIIFLAEGKISSGKLLLTNYNTLYIDTDEFFLPISKPTTNNCHSGPL